MKFRGSSRVQALVNLHKDILPLNKLLTTVVTDMYLDEDPDLNWAGIDDEAFTKISNQLDISDTMQQRWLDLGNL
jgi:hypothetical protein